MNNCAHVSLISLPIEKSSLPWNRFEQLSIHGMLLYQFDPNMILIHEDIFLQSMTIELDERGKVISSFPIFLFNSGKNLLTWQFCKINITQNIHHVLS